MNIVNSLWCEAYRPQTISDTILPKNIKDSFHAFVKKNDLPNLLLSGGPGTGKTTIAKAVVRELDYDFMLVNGSDSSESGLDSLRTNIRTFASSVSLTGSKKVVIIDEADHLSAAVQPALRNFMETLSANSRFILTCNYRNRIIEPLQSRLSHFDFFIPKEEKSVLFEEFMNRMTKILDDHEVKYNKRIIAEFVIKHFPDFRKIINELQKSSVGGVIDKSILSAVKEDAVHELYENMKNKNFTEMRKWVADNLDLSSSDVFRKMFETMNTYVSTKSIPAFVVILADYQFKSMQVPDQELNLVACLTEVMAEVEFV
jgi:DNA polymerase III delta prime subunit